MKRISLFAFGFLILCAFGRADAIYVVTLDTAPLLGNANAPFKLDFQLTDGSGAGDGNNSASLSQFQFAFGGAATAGTITITNDVSGSLSSTILMADSSFFNEFSQAFIPGSALSFQLDLTNNSDSGGTPDEFIFQLLDRTGNEVPTTDPSGSNSLVIIDLTGFTPVPQIYTTSGDGFTITPILSSSTPEPGTLWLLATSAGLFVITQRRRRGNGL